MEGLTVFTPTYNRVYCLHNLYESLKEQTNKDFVWLIIDDGSTDGTFNMVKGFKEEGIINIQYYIQENSGKHAAHNRAVELCETELFVCVDSDDRLTKDAVAIIYKRYDENNNRKILGLYLRKATLDMTNIALPYPDGLHEVGICDLYHKWKYSGDTVIVLVSSMIKEYSFPVYPEERFVSEVVFYNQLNDLAPMVLCEDKIYLCEYMPDGYTQNTDKLMIKNPMGTATMCLSEAYYGSDIIYKAKNYSQYLALIQLFSLDSRRIRICPKPKLYIRIMGWILKEHYIRFFGRMKAKYEY